MNSSKKSRMPPKLKDNLYTVDFSKAPPYLQCNPYITSGYRPQLTPYQSFKSCFMWSNETINIWSHLFGFCVFICLFGYDIFVLLPDTNTKYSGADVAVAAFALTCFMCCMLLSALYHTFNCCSQESYSRWLSWDLIGISLAFCGVFLSGIIYGFWCNEHIALRNLYLFMVVTLFTASMVFTLTPSLFISEWDTVRLRLYMGWALSGFLPTAHWVWLHMYHDILLVFLPRVLTMYALCGVALLLYIWRIPEIFWPGKFDWIGSSHQLWHLLIVAALVYWHQTGLLYASHRQLFRCYS